MTHQMRELRKRQSGSQASTTSGKEMPAYKPKYKKPSIGDVIASIGRITSIHEACAKIPMIGPRDFDRLVDDIRSDGLIEPVKINADGVLLDGRSRLMACHFLLIPITDEMVVVTDQDPIAIARANLSRRHLGPNRIDKTVDQLTMLAAERLEAVAKEAAQKKKAGNAKGGATKAGRGKSTGKTPVKQKRALNSVEVVSKETGVSQRNLKTAKQLKSKTPELAEKVLNGDMSLKQAAAEAGLARPEKEKCKPTQKCNSQRVGQGSGFCNQPEVVFDRGPIVVACKGAYVVAMIFEGQWQVCGHDDDSAECRDAENKDDAREIAMEIAKLLVESRNESGEEN